MIEEEGYIEIFERYRNGDMSASERTEFEARLAYDSEFKNAYEVYQSLESGVKTHFRNELKSKLKEVDQVMDNAPKKSNTLKLVMWTSSVAAAIIISVFIFQHFSEPNTTLLAQEYWPYEEGLPVKMSTKGRYDDAMNAFKLNDYSKASRLLSHIDSDTATYFSGVVAYEQDDYKKAVELLNQIKENSSYYQEAQFRLSLVLLITGDFSEAKQILENQIANKTVYSKVSEEIIEKLR